MACRARGVYYLTYWAPQRLIKWLLPFHSNSWEYRQALAAMATVSLWFISLIIKSENNKAQWRNWVSTLAALASLSLYRVRHNVGFVLLMPGKGSNVLLRAVLFYKGGYLTKQLSQTNSVEEKQREGHSWAQQTAPPAHRGRTDMNVNLDGT